MPKPLELTWNFQFLPYTQSHIFFSPFIGYIFLIYPFTKKNHQSHILSNTILSFLFPLEELHSSCYHETNSQKPICQI